MNYEDIKAVENGFLKAALYYAYFGLHVFPCAERTKRPLTENGFYDATTDHEIICSWWDKHPCANVAVRTGKETGLYVVDIDVDDRKGKNGFNDIEQFSGVDFKTLKQKTPSGGNHYFYKSDVELGCVKLTSAIDIRGDGGYVLAFPSIHPNGGIYIWESSDPIENRDLVKDIPESIKEVIVNKSKIEPLDFSNKKINTEAGNVIERAIEYVKECDPAVQGQYGHGALLWACTALGCGFDLDEHTSYNILAEHYNPRCSPPWDLSHPRWDKEFRRKVREGRMAVRFNSRPRGWLLMEDAPVTMHVSEDVFNAINNGSEKTEEMSPERPLPRKISEHLLNPPGLVGEILRYMNETAVKQQPILSLGSALTFVGSLISKKVKTEYGMHPNMYAMGIAGSCEGKENPLSAVKKICMAAGIDELLGGEDVTSDASIELSLEENHGKTLFLWDEIGFMFSDSNSSNASSHQKKIVPMLMKLYSKADQVYKGKKYADGEQRVIYKPSCSVYGTTVPNRFYEGINRSQLSDGWLSRCIVFISEHDPMPDRRRAKYRPVPDSIKNQVQAWYHKKIKKQDEQDLGINVEPDVVKATPEAEEIFNKFEKLADEKRRHEKAKGSNVESLWGRAAGHAYKISLIIACGEDIENPVIDEYHARYACELSEYLVGKFIDEAIENIYESKGQSDKQTICSFIRNSGIKGVTKTEISRATQKLSRKERNDHIDDLIESELIINVQVGSKKKYFSYEFKAEIEKLVEESKTQIRKTFKV